MRFASYVLPTGITTWGAAVGEDLIDLGPSGANIASTLKAAISADALPTAVARDAARIPASEVDFLPCITDPGKILCVGVNYRTHREETSHTQAPSPTIFTRFADSQVGHERPAVYPSVSEQFDYEGEMAVVIGTAGRNIAPGRAFSHVAGYAPYNDFTARDWQRSATQWTPGKNFPGTGAFGPFLTTSDEITDISRLRLQTRVNDEVRQDASLSDLIFDIPRLIAYISTFTPLSPGDVIVSGTPGGVGLFRTPPALLNDGDVVEVEISGMPVLRNRVVREETPATADAAVGGQV